jgi:phage gpG-like protein
VIYAATHQGGATIRGKAGPLKFKLPGGLGFVSPQEVIIPARPFLGVSAEDAAEIVAIGEDYLAEGMPDGAA